MKKVIFVRVPRTASTNFTGVLEKIYKPKIIRDLVWQEMPAKERTAKLKKGEYFYDFDNMKYPAKNIRQYNAIEGHFLASKYDDLRDDYEFVTFLRNPVERVISHFNIIVSRQDRLKIDIKRFAEIYKNFHKAMIGNVDDYSFIGITELFTLSVGQFYQKFDIPSNLRMDVRSRKKVRSVKKKRAVSVKEREYIKEINAEDFEIYNSIRKQLVDLQKKKTKNQKEKQEKIRKEKIETKRRNRVEQRKSGRKERQLERRNNKSKKKPPPRPPLPRGESGAGGGPSDKKEKERK